MAGDNMKSAGEFSFCVAIPMYNEECNAERCVKTIHGFLQHINGVLKGINVDSAIIVVNDGSTDGTSAMLEKISCDINNLIVEAHVQNKGYGAANVTCIRRAQQEGFDYILFMDADLTQNIKYVYKFVEEMSKGVDFIKATRYSKGGGVRGVPLSRWFVSWVGNLLARIILRLPITDYTNGFRAGKTNILSQIECKDKGFPYLIEEVCKVSKIAISYSEVPYILTIRENNNCVSKFRYSPTVFYNYLRYLLK